jgi:hypothetical protein
MHVTVVRQNRASSMSLRSVLPVWGATLAFDFIDENTPVRFLPETAFILVNAHSH